MSLLPRAMETDLCSRSRSKKNYLDTGLPRIEPAMAVRFDLVLQLAGLIPGRGSAVVAHTRVKVSR